jgi:hypothetical protein
MLDVASQEDLHDLLSVLATMSGHFETSSLITLALEKRTDRGAPPPADKMAMDSYRGTTLGLLRCLEMLGLLIESDLAYEIVPNERVSFGLRSAVQLIASRGRLVDWTVAGPQSPGTRILHALEDQRRTFGPTFRSCHVAYALVLAEWRGERVVLISFDPTEWGTIKFVGGQRNREHDSPAASAQTLIAKLVECFGGGVEADVHFHDLCNFETPDISRTVGVYTNYSVEVLTVQSSSQGVFSQPRSPLTAWVKVEEVLVGFRQYPALFFKDLFQSPQVLEQLRSPSHLIPLSGPMSIQPLDKFIVGRLDGVYEVAEREAERLAQS